MDVTEKTLEKMNVATGHRLKIMKAIKDRKGTIMLGVAVDHQNNTLNREG